MVKPIWGHMYLVEGINEHALPMTLTKSRKVQFPIQIFVMPTSYSTSMHNGGTLPPLQALPGFHNPPPTNIDHQGYTTYTMNSSLVGSHQWLILLALCIIHIYINKELRLLLWILIIFPKCMLTKKNTNIQAYIEPHQHNNIKIHAPNPHPKLNKILHKHIHLKCIHTPSYY
jgi:hypothetical protein